jgi:tripartite-type tricarboxylate transporter receptor subunit TctC
MQRRTFLTAAAATAALPHEALWAQSAYPNKPFTLVVPFPPGGVTDLISRALADGLGRRVNQRVIVDNKPGAGGNIGAQFVARATSDGYTMLMGPIGPIAVNPAIYDKMGFDPRKDLAPVVRVASLPNVLVVNPEQIKATNIREFIDYAKANPGKLSYGSFGNGSSAHLCGELFKRNAKIDMVHVPYRGSAQAMQDLLGGRIQLMFDSLPTALPHIRAGKIRALGVTSSIRSIVAPEIPTISQTTGAGLRDFELNPWFGVFVPAGTPRSIVAVLNREVNEVLRDKKVRDTMSTQGAFVHGGTVEAFAKFVEDESLRWQTFVRIAGIKAD